MTPDDPRHGTVSGYKNQGCCCQACRAAAWRYDKRRKYLAETGRSLRLPSLGTRRRVRALMRIGYGLPTLAAELGVATGNLSSKLQQPYVSRRTHKAVADVFDRLSMAPQPSGWMAQRTRNIASKRGWLPPLAWDDIDDPDESPNLGGTDNEVDPVVVLRVLQGDRIDAATNAERCAIVARWHETGRPYNDLERQTGWQVWRYRTKDEAAS